MQLELFVCISSFKTKRKNTLYPNNFLRSGTSIGANIKEAIRGFSKKDFRFKLGIALKEASETEYWLELLYETEYISEKQFLSMNDDCIELIKILTAILNSSKDNEVDSEKN